MASLYRFSLRAHFTAEALYLRDSTRINDLYLRLAREERSDLDVVHYHMMRTELPLSYHGIEGNRTAGQHAKDARKAWIGCRGQLSQPARR
jgi:hypothetical protein